MQMMYQNVMSKPFYPQFIPAYYDHVLSLQYHNILTALLLQFIVAKLRKKIFLQQCLNIMAMY